MTTEHLPPLLFLSGRYRIGKLSTRPLCHIRRCRHTRTSGPRPRHRSWCRCSAGLSQVKVAGGRTREANWKGQRLQAFCELRWLLSFCSGAGSLLALWTRVLHASGGKGLASEWHTSGRRPCPEARAAGAPGGSPSSSSGAARWPRPWPPPQRSWSQSCRGRPRVNRQRQAGGLEEEQRKRKSHFKGLTGPTT